MSGERDLHVLLANMDVSRRQGAFAYILAASGTPAPPDTYAMIDEGETTAFVVDADSPLGEQAPFRAAWLTLTMHSALEAVGLTAAVSTALAAAGISANVLAGFYHDHILVPEERAEDAIEVLLGLKGC
jgi:hypothetical protein